MSPLTTYSTLLLASISILLITSTTPHNNLERIPHGSSLFSLSTRQLLKRLEGVPSPAVNPDGTDCGGDDNGCITTDWGCSCPFSDSSWMPDSAAASSSASPPRTILISATTPPPTSAPAPTPAAPPPSSPAVTCSKRGPSGCVCTDGSTPTQNEDGAALRQMTKVEIISVFSEDGCFLDCCWYYGGRYSGSGAVDCQSGRGNGTKYYLLYGDARLVMKKAALIARSECDEQRIHIPLRLHR